MQIVIDGYNLLKLLYPWESGDDRENLLALLETYRKRKGGRITVVFDGWMTGRLGDSREKAAGIQVIYTGQDRKADERIKALAKNLGSGCVVVSSDRSVCLSAESAGASAISSEEFAGRLASSADDGEEYADTGEKKGNPRRASKKARKRQAALRKL